MAEKDTDTQGKPTDKTGGSEDLSNVVEELLDKIAKIAGEPDASVDGAASNIQGVVNQLGVLSVSKEEGGVTLPNNAPPFSDFVPKAGQDLDTQQEEHNRKKQQRQQRRLEKQKASQEGNPEQEDDSDDISSSDEDKEVACDDPVPSSQVNHPTLTELIFGEKFNMQEAEASYTPDKLKLLLAQILPEDGKITGEEEGIPMPQDDSPIFFDMGQNLGPEKLKALHEMLGMIDEAGQQRKGLF